MGLMTREEKERAIDTLLVMMNDEVENEGETVRTCTFNLANDKGIITKFGSMDRLLETIKVSVSRGFIKYLYLGHGNFDGIQLTEEGQGRAISVINAKPKNEESDSKYSIGTVNNYNSSMQIGDNNTQNIDNAIKLIIHEIEKSNYPEPQKQEAKNLFGKFIEHPLTQTLLNSATAIGAALIGG